MLRKNRASSLKSAVRPVLESLEERRLMSGTLTLVNTDGLPASNRLIFNVIKNLDSTTPNATHNTSVLQLQNTGTSTLTINSLIASGPFSVVNPPAAGTTVAAGASLNVTVSFTQTTLPAHSQNETNFTTNPNGGASITGSLAINTSDTAAPTKTVTLAGYWQNESEHNAEPNLTTIVNKLAGYQTVISNPYAVDLTQPATSRQLYGSEIYSAKWTAANTSQPVKMQGLAEFHTEGNVVNTYWYDTNAAGGINSHKVVASLPNEGQTLLPHQASTTFNPNGKSFGFRIDNEYSDDTVNIANNNGGGGGHHFRFFPLVDSTGTAVANTYIMAMDYAVIQSENFDFQDNVFIVSNIRPSTAPPAPGNLTATGGAQPVLSWSAVTYTPLAGYNVSRASSANGTYTLLTSTPITATTFTDTTASGGSTFYYQVTAVDSSATPAVQSQAATVSVNTPGGPVAVADTINANSGQATAVNVLGNDTDTTGTIDPSTVTIVQAPNHAGTVSVNASAGSITYTSAAGFSGAETFTYTERDNNGALSSAATVTVNVSNPQTSNPTAVDDRALVLENSTVSINVLANDLAATTLDATSVVIGGTGGHGTSHGATTVNADGTVSYTPNANFVGSDSFTYTVTDANGRTSSSATVNINTGVQITNVAKTGTKSVSYTDGNKTPVTITLSRGQAAIYFNGNGSSAVSKGRITLTGSGFTVANITLTSTSAASALNILSNAGTVNVFGITDTGTLGAINGKTTNFIGTVQVGGLNSLTFKNVDGHNDTGAPSQILIGSGTAGTALRFAAVTDTSINSTAALKSVSANSWLNTFNDTIGISAPSLASLKIAGEFDPSLNLSGTGTDLGTAVIGGTLGTGYWSVGGTTRSVSVGKTGSAWGATFGNLAAFTVRAAGLNADLNATTIGNLKVTGDITGSVNAVSAKAIHVTGAITNSSLTFSNAAGATQALGVLTVTGAVTGSSITSTGNVGTISVASLVGSNILIGTTATSVADATAANVGTATLKSFSVKSKAPLGFSNSSVVAGTITSASTGQVDATSTGREGLAAKSFKSVSVGVAGATVHIPAADLVNSSALSTYLTSRGVTFGKFEIDILNAVAG